MILEGIVTTKNPDGGVNIAPMGPIVDEAMTSLQLRPFRTSLTYANLKRTGCGVFHVVDDVLLLARAALHQFAEQPPIFPAEQIDGAVLSAACRWYEFRTTGFDDSNERTDFRAEVIHTGRLKDHFGFNRAKHAVLEAAILCTRLHILPGTDIRRQFADLAVIVEKTAGPREQEAFALLKSHFEHHSQ